MISPFTSPFCRGFRWFPNDRTQATDLCPREHELGSYGLPRLWAFWDDRACGTSEAGWGQLEMFPQMVNIYLYIYIFIIYIYIHTHIYIYVNQFSSINTISTHIIYRNWRCFQWYVLILCWYMKTEKEAPNCAIWRSCSSLQVWRGLLGRLYNDMWHVFF